MSTTVYVFIEKNINTFHLKKVPYLELYVVLYFANFNENPYLCLRGYLRQDIMYITSHYDKLHVQV